MHISTNRNLREHIILIVGIFLVSRLVIVITAWLAVTQVQPHMPEDSFPWRYTESALIDAFGAWDAGWYLGIAQWGYAEKTFDPDNPEYSNHAFFPAYPMLVRTLFQPIFGKDLYIPGLVLSNALFLAALFLLYPLVRLRFDDTTATWSVVFTAFFPNSYIFSCFYTESLFLFLVTGSILCALKGRWWTAAVFGAILSAVRVNGVVIALPILCLYLYQNRDVFKNPLDARHLRNLCSFAIYPLGLLAYMVFLYIHVGDPLAFLKAQTAWEREAGFYLHELVLGLFSSNSSKVYLTAYALTCTILLHWLLRYREIFLYATGALLILPAFITALPHIPFVSVPRYYLIVFPVMVALARMTRDHPLAQSVTLAFLAMLNGCLVVLWSLGMNIVS